MKNEPRSRNSEVRVEPIIIGPANARAATGWPWRWVRDTATALGVPLLRYGRKQGVRADLFIAKLEAFRGETNSVDPLKTVDLMSTEEAAAHVRKLLGKKRRDER